MHLHAFCSVNSLSLLSFPSSVDFPALVVNPAMDQNLAVQGRSQNVQKGKIDQTVGALKTPSKDNLQCGENTLSPSGFTVMTNPMYEYPRVCITSPADDLAQAVHIPLLNEVPKVQVNPADPASYLRNPHVNNVTKGESSKIAEVSKLCHALTERLKVVEGKDAFGLDASDLCLVPDVVIPPKFKIPDFEKYKGSSCPRTHLTMYCRKMTAYSHDDKLLIHCFQDSLSGASLQWYMQLEQVHIHTWRDLAEAFMKHYHYNTDMAPTRAQLQSLTQKNAESFREYAQRWRDLAAQIQPPLLEKELVSIFMDTLQSPYWERMLSCASSNFSNLVIVGEHIESGLKSGKILDTSGSQTGEEESSDDSQEILKERKVWEASQAPLQ